ncbi:peptidoglycan-binding domain-containing protein [Streptomyces sp. NPDC001222]|uniref:peptidoglycan-binding domain-containing protein n=1 Tax=Streptomyces sp. NPDC001222 TaxID=3364548 RepID=UPI0036BFA118
MSQNKLIRALGVLAVTASVLGTAATGVASAAPAASSSVMAPAVHGCNYTTSQPTLRPGSSGSAVKELQCLLKYWGFNPGAIDGIFGSGTEKAVKQFQAWWPLAVDGVVGPDTWTALKS